MNNVRMKNKKPITDLVIPAVAIEDKIYIIREEKVMIDEDLATLYQIEVRTLNQAVQRNISRFPSDFMFKLNKEEVENLRSQFATSSYGGRRYETYAFTEQGIAMLSSVLRSPRAVQINIQIMRAFTKMRKLLASHTEFREKIIELEQKYDESFRIVFRAIEEILDEKEEPKEKLGFDPNK
jgi:phage regulator Rha-like protein